jgi:hypothetical protein
MFMFLKFCTVLVLYCILRCNFILYAVLQELRETTSKTLSIMMCMDLVLNKEKYPDQIVASRKICSFMAKKLGTSREDLPAMTKSKVDALGAQEPSSGSAKLNSVMDWVVLGGGSFVLFGTNQPNEGFLPLVVAWFVFGSRNFIFGPGFRFSSQVSPSLSFVSGSVQRPARKPRRQRRKTPRERKRRPRTRFRQKKEEGKGGQVSD